MDLSICADCYSPNDTLRLLIFFLLFWPLITFGFLRRGRSPMPLLATLLPFALATAVMWMQIARVIEFMAISGGIAARSAGLAEALSAPLYATASAALIAVVALIRRHAPTVDHFTIVFALAIAAEVVAALLFTAWIEPVTRQIALAFVWAGTAFVIALAIATRMVMLRSKTV